MAQLAFIGTGLMGSGMVEAARRRGHPVTVWNRTLARARNLEQFGARVAQTLEEAVRSADHIHLVLSDDAVVDDVLARLASALPPKAVVIDHSTVSPEGTRRRFAWCDAHKVAFLHAPVFMSPQMCRDGTGLMLCAGPKDRLEPVRPALEKMTGDLWYVGERVDLAAAYKLFGNAMIFAMLGGLTDVFEMGASLGVDARDVMALFGHFKPGGTLDFRGPKMANLDFRATFDLAMARKDMRLMLEAAGSDAHLMVLPGLAARMDAALAKGQAQEDVAVVSREAVVRSRKTSAPR